VTLPTCDRRAALAFIAAENVIKPIIFGHSMGGMVTLNLLRAAPELPRAAVLVDIGPEVNTPRHGNDP
jgi:pimeloyl-ACP methyl ester carboxylesterase